MVHDVDMDVEAIVLKALPYGERDRLITLFCQQGLVRCFVKHPARLQPNLLALTTPFTKGQYLLSARKTMLYQFVDGSVLEQHLGIRHSLEQLHTATSMVRTLLHTQWPDKPAPALYALFAKFLQKIDEADHPLLTPFLVKVLKHEGILQTEQEEGWSQEEHRVLMQLANMRSLDYIPVPTASLVKKIESFFDSAFSSNYSKTTVPSATVTSRVKTTFAL